MRHRIDCAAFFIVLEVKTMIVVLKHNVPEEKRAAITAAVLRLDLHTMAADIIQRTVRQAERGFEVLTEK